MSDKTEVAQADEAPDPVRDFVAWMAERAALEERYGRCPGTRFCRSSDPCLLHQMMARLGKERL